MALEASKMGFQGLQDSEPKGLGPLRLEGQGNFTSENEANALRLKILPYLETPRFFLGNNSIAIIAFGAFQSTVPKY